MWALIDLTSAYASMIQSLEPATRGRPVIVTSSNDGVVVAISPEAKAMGLKKVRSALAANRCAAQAPTRCSDPQKLNLRAL